MREVRIVLTHGGENKVGELQSGVEEEGEGEGTHRS